MTHSGTEDKGGEQPRWRVKQESRWSMNANEMLLKRLLRVSRIHLALITVAKSSSVVFPLTLNFLSRIAQRISRLKSGRSCQCFEQTGQLVVVFSLLDDWCLTAGWNPFPWWNSCSMGDKVAPRHTSPRRAFILQSLSYIFFKLSPWPLTDHRPLGRHPEEPIVRHARSALKAKYEPH